MNKKIKTVCFLLVCLMLAGCGSNQQEQTTKELETGFIPARAGMYDSADTAVIRQMNKKDGTITFYNLVRGKNYTLSYDGTTEFLDKYGSSLSIEQIDEGDIVDITFLKEKKKLASVQKSDDSFLLEDVSGCTIDERVKEITVGDATYRYEEDLFIFSDGKQAEIMDINAADSLRIQGIDHTIYSIYVDKGHGYLRLKNDEYFRGGWIEVGQSIIRPIEEDMLLVVPEGKYEVLLSTKGITGTKTVTIKRDKETELDIGDLKKEELKKYGNLIFAVSPDTATVYIDGEEVDISGPVSVEYGIHQMMAKAEDYLTITRYIKVGQENATIQVTLEKDDGNSVSQNSIDSTVTENDAASATGATVTIDAPIGAEVYVDGSYIGIAPISFKKTAGIHVITLRMDGYETRSYTINITDLTGNESMSFSPLVKAEEEEETETETEEETKSDEEDDMKDDKESDEDSDNEEDAGKEDKEEESSSESEGSVSENSSKNE